VRLTLGILEDHHLEHVPGTAVLNDMSLDIGIADTSRLKHGRGRNAHIVLVPQPSNDPNDPLNWPPWKKEFIILLVSGAALMATVVYCSILPATLILAGVFDQSYHRGFQLYGSPCYGDWMRNLFYVRCGKKVEETTRIFSFRYSDDARLCLGRCISILDITLCCSSFPGVSVLLWLKHS
jgi:hypothetical protein